MAVAALATDECADTLRTFERVDFIWTRVTPPFGTGSAVAQSHGNCVFNLLKNRRLFFQSQYLTSKVEGASFRTFSQMLVYFFILAILVVSHCGFWGTFPGK